MIVQARRIVQGATVVLLVLVPLMNKRGYTFLSGSLYSFAVGPVWFTDPLIGFQTVLTTVSLDMMLFLSLLIPVFTALALGRVFCGWFCPQNTISELIDKLASALGLRRSLTPRSTAVPRYVLLGVLLMFIPLLGIPLASLLSAPGIISVQTAQIVTQGTVGLELGLIGLIVVVELFLARRAWCNLFCPVGSFLGLLRTSRTLKIAFRPDRDRPCGHCLACAEACQLGLDPLKKGLYPQCHNCGACVAACDGIQGDKKPLVFEW